VCVCVCVCVFYGNSHHTQVTTIADNQPGLPCCYVLRDNIFRSIFVIFNVLGSSNNLLFLWKKPVKRGTTSGKPGNLSRVWSSGNLVADRPGLSRNNASIAGMIPATSVIGTPVSRFAGMIYKPRHAIHTYLALYTHYTHSIQTKIWCTHYTHYFT
jgi:hypothetical protein